MPKRCMHIETDVWDIRFANTQNHGHWPLPYLAVGNEFAKFTEAADKTLTQRLLYVSSPAREPVIVRRDAGSVSSFWNTTLGSVGSWASDV